MAVKDRMTDLLNRRNSTWESHQMIPCVQGNNDRAIEALLESAEEIQKQVRELEVRVRELKCLHTEIVTSPRWDKELDQTLTDTRERVWNLSDCIISGLSKIDPRNMKGQESSDEKQTQGNFSAEVRMRQVHYNAMSALFTQALNSFNILEVEFADKMRTRVRRQLSIAGKKERSEPFREILQQERAYSLLAQNIITDDVLKAELQQCLLEEKQVLVLEEKVQEVHTLFRQLRSLVHHQGNKVESIANHVHRSESYIEAGVDHFNKAEPFKRKFRKKMLFLLGGSITGLMVTLTVIFLTLL